MGSIQKLKTHLSPSERKKRLKIVLQVLSDYGYVTKEDQCILQCFDARELEQLEYSCAQLFLVQLLDSEEEVQQLDYLPLMQMVWEWYRQILSEMVDRVLLLL